MDVVVYGIKSINNKKLTDYITNIVLPLGCDKWHTMNNETLTDYLSKVLFPTTCIGCEFCELRLEEITDILSKEGIIDSFVNV